MPTLKNPTDSRRVAKTALRTDGIADGDTTGMSRQHHSGASWANVDAREGQAALLLEGAKEERRGVCTELPHVPNVKRTV